MVGLDTLGKFEMHDLVSLDQRTVGCIVRIERAGLIVLDQMGQKRTVRPQQVELKKLNRGFALDSDQNEITKNSMVRVLDGPFKGRDGKVLHVFRSFVFIFKREIAEHNGVFVVRAKQVSVSGKSNKVSGLSAVPQSPSMYGSDGGRGRGQSGRGRGGRGRRGRGRNSELLYKTVRIIAGPDKGKIGIVKDCREEHVKIELHSTYRTKMYSVKEVKDINDVSSNANPQRNYFEGARTPMVGSQTPAYPRLGGSTPAHDGSRTPRGDMTPGYSGSAWDPSNLPAPEPTPNPATPGETGDYDDMSTYEASPYPSTPGAAPTPGMAPTPYDPYDSYAAQPKTPDAAYDSYSGSAATPVGSAQNDAATPRMLLSFQLLASHNSL